MKKLLAIALLPLMLVSCGGKNTGDTSLGKIKNDKMVLRTASDQFFSSSLKYSCTTADCNENVVLVAIKNKKELNTCTGTQVSPSEVLVASTCFTRDLEELNRACDQKIEVHDVDGKIAKCQKVTNKYTNSLGDSIYKISLNSDLRDVAEPKFSEIEKGNTDVDVISTSKRNQLVTQTKTSCKLSYRLINFPSVISNKSELQNIAECTLEAGDIVIQSKSLLIAQSKDYGTNLYCLANKCEKRGYLKEKFINLINRSKNQKHVRMLSFLKRESIDNSYSIGKPNVMVTDSLVIFYNEISCLKNNKSRHFDYMMALPYSVKNNVISLHSTPKRLQNRYIPIGLTSNYDSFKRASLSFSTVTALSNTSKFFVSKNETYRQYEFTRDGKFIVKNDLSKVQDIKICN